MKGKAKGKGGRWRLAGRLFLNQFRGGGLRVLSRLSWELPQTVVGFWAGLIVLARFKGEMEMGCWEGVTVIRGSRRGKNWGGICFGSVIIGDGRIGARVNNALFMHEFGHSLQSRGSGPLYLLKYGLPSLISALGPLVHSEHPVERDANLRAMHYFSCQAGFGEWPLHAHPVPAHGSYLRCAWWEYLPPVFPLLPMYRAYRQRFSPSRPN